MTDEIRPAQLYRARRVRPLSREDREENEARFHKKLAELAEAADRRRHGEGQGQDSPPDREHEPRQAPSHMGRHLDIET